MWELQKIWRYIQGLCFRFSMFLLLRTVSEKSASGIFIPNALSIMSAIFDWCLPQGAEMADDAYRSKISKVMSPLWQDRVFKYLQTTQHIWLFVLYDSALQWRKIYLHLKHALSSKIRFFGNSLPKPFILVSLERSRNDLVLTGCIKENCFKAWKHERKWLRAEIFQNRLTLSHFQKFLSQIPFAKQQPKF